MAASILYNPLLVMPSFCQRPVASTGSIVAASALAKAACVVAFANSIWGVKASSFSNSPVAVLRLKGVMRTTPIV